MKRFLAMVLLTSLILAVPVLAFADPIEKSVDLTYVVPEKYTFTIPEQGLSLSSDATQLPLSFSGNIESVQVSISTAHNFNLLNTQDNSQMISYQLFDGSSLITMNNSVTVMNGVTKILTVDIVDETLTGVKAGTYTDSITFTIQ